MGRAKVARRAPDRPKCSKKTCFSASVFLSEATCFRKYLLSTGLWSVHSEYFPEKILAPPEIAPWIFPLNCCPSHSEGQSKSGKWWGYQTWLGDAPHFWNFRNLLWDLWPWTNRTKEIKRKLRNRYFFSEVMAYREKADTKEPYCS